MYAPPPRLWFSRGAERGDDQRERERESARAEAVWEKARAGRRRMEKEGRGQAARGGADLRTTPLQKRAAVPRRARI